MSNQALALLVLLFPAAGAILLAGRGWRLPRIFTVIIGPGVVWASFVTVLALFFGQAHGDFTYWTWIKSGSFEVPFNLLVDNLSIFMCLVITGVGGLIVTYSIGYMGHEDDPSYARFFTYMDVFILSMLLLVLAGNFVFLIVGWALVGLSSYLLIGFWYQRRSAVVAARKAFVMNVIGDVGTYAHAAVAIIGAVTALFAATIAIVQVGIKRVLAYSTMSQIGYMFLAVGIGAYSAGFFHLLSHAFFKALLFMAAGNVIHAMKDEQDMRKFGGLWRDMRRSSITFLAGSLSLAGIIPFVGFFSKDSILAEAFNRGGSLGYWVWALGFVTAVLTAFYTGRMWWFAFVRPASPDRPVEHPHEAPAVMFVPVAILAVLATVGGVLQTSPLPFGPRLVDDWLAPVVGLPS